jgi:hypothetical protein
MKAISFSLLSVLLILAGAQAQTAGKNLVQQADFEKSFPHAHPWTGLDDDGSLNVYVFYKRWENQMPQQNLINSEGNRVRADYPSSVGIGDLNGDGLPDLLVASSTGYFFYYPNSGTPTAPQFTYADIIPITISPNGIKIPCPKINLVDYNDDGLLDLVMGDYMGHLFFLPNVGTKQKPKFVTEFDYLQHEVKTNEKGHLWCNFLSPIYFDWTGDGKRDLICGEGTYSANNVYLIKNAGSNTTPLFDSYQRIPLLEGTGKEQLTPQIVDWNGDGKPDILLGERTGEVNVYLNTSTDPLKPSFDGPKPVLFGSSNKVGALSCPVPGDLNGDGLFDLVFGLPDGSIKVAYNTGSKEQPKFGAPVGLKGVDPGTKYASQNQWSILSNAYYYYLVPRRSLYHILHVVNNDEKNPATFEKDYTPPPQFLGKSSIKLEFLNIPTRFISGSMPLGEDKTYHIRWNGNFTMQDSVGYEVSFNYKTTGFSNAKIHIGGINFDSEDRVDITKEISATSSWSTFKEIFKYKSKEKGTSVGVSVEFTMDITAPDANFYLNSPSIIMQK